MLHIRLCVTLLLAATCCVHTIAERVTSCNSVQRLSCEQGVIEVQKAFYGRADTETCSEVQDKQQLMKTDCSEPAAKHIVSRSCNGKKVCELAINDFNNPDPCPDTHKYLDTTYTCIPAISVVACEYSVAYLECYTGQNLVIRGAHYGRSDRTTCSFRRLESKVNNTRCSTPTDKVAERCGGKNNCSISVRNHQFGDPCVGTYKYLETAYTCEYPGTSV